MSTGSLAPTGKYVGLADMVVRYNDESDRLLVLNVDRVCIRGVESHDVF